MFLGPNAVPSSVLAANDGARGVKKVRACAAHQKTSGEGRLTSNEQRNLGKVAVRENLGRIVRNQLAVDDREPSECRGGSVESLEREAAEACERVRRVTAASLVDDLVEEGLVHGFDRKVRQGEGGARLEDAGVEQRRLFLGIAEHLVRDGHGASAAEQGRE